MKYSISLGQELDLTLLIPLVERLSQSSSQHIGRACSHLEAGKRVCFPSSLMWLLVGFSGKDVPVHIPTSVPCWLLIGGHPQFLATWPSPEGSSQMAGGFTKASQGKGEGGSAGGGGGWGRGTLARWKSWFCNVIADLTCHHFP